MRTNPLILSAVLALAHSTAALAAEKPSPDRAEAQDSSKDRCALQADLVTFIPVGGLSDVSGLGAGGLVSFDVLVASGTTLSLRTGYVVGQSQRQVLPIGTIETSMGSAPVLVGVRRYFGGEGRNGLYLSGELGLAISTGRAEVLTGLAWSTTVDTVTKVGTQLAAGYAFNGVDLRFAAMTLDLEHPGNSTAITAGVGYAFATF